MSDTSEAERLAEVQRWLRFAHEDLAAPQASLRYRGFVPRQACFLAQQAAEKALKAILVYLQVDFPKNHDLDALRNRIPREWSVAREPLRLQILTEWAVEARYPGDLPW
jgi:HEPN domain-containing protein